MVHGKGGAKPLASAFQRVNPIFGNADSDMTRRASDFNSCPTFGNYFVVEMWRAMKLMGISRLEELARCARGSLDGAVPALVAELEAGSWGSMKEIAELYPSATVDGTRIRIPIDGAYWVDVLADCEAQMVLIEYTGATSGTRAMGKTGSKVI